VEASRLVFVVGGAVSSLSGLSIRSFQQNSLREGEIGGKIWRRGLGKAEGVFLERMSPSRMFRDA